MGDRASTPVVGVFSPLEVSDVIARYPQLRQSAPEIVEGVVEIHATYNGVTIADSFEVRFVAAAGYPHTLPLLEVAPSRIAAIQSRRRVSDVRDLHQNGAASCVCAPQDESKKFPTGSRLIDFIENLAVPFLYALSRFEQTGRWPWGEYAHGTLGVLEYYADHPSAPSREELARVAGIILKDSHAKELRKQLRRPRKNWACPCGSRRPFQHCHPLAWTGIVVLSKHLCNEGIALIDDAIDVP